MFKIVETIENGNKSYCSVPHNWEKNSNLFWPNHLKASQIEKLKKDILSMPDKNWNSFKCKVKGSANTYIEALQLERLFVSFVDTEAEESYNQVPKHRKRNIKNNYVETAVNDYNIFIENYLDFDEVPEEEIILSNAGTSSEQANNKVANITSNYTQLIDEINELKCEVENIKEKQIYLQETVNSQFASINVKLDQLLKPTGDATENNNCESNNQFTKGTKFPLMEIREILALNNDLQDADFKKEMIKRLTVIGGTTKTENGTKVMYKIIDHLFDPILLNQFSWTGSSKSKGKKECFQRLQNIVDIIYEVIVLADCRHSKSRNEKYLKDKVLKHSGQRLKRKRDQSITKSMHVLITQGINSSEEI